MPGYQLFCIALNGMLVDRESCEINMYLSGQRLLTFKRVPEPAESGTGVRYQDWALQKSSTYGNTTYELNQFSPNKEGSNYIFLSLVKNNDKIHVAKGDYSDYSWGAGMHLLYQPSEYGKFTISLGNVGAICTVAEWTRFLSEPNAGSIEVTTGSANTAGIAGLASVALIQPV